MNSTVLRHPAAVEATPSAVSNPLHLEAANSCACLVLVESCSVPAQRSAQPQHGKLYYRVLVAMLAGVVMLVMTIAQVTPAVALPAQSIQGFIGV